MFFVADVHRHLLLLAVVCPVILHGQQPVFEAAVLRQNRSGDEGTSIGQRPGGQYIMTNGNIALLLQNAYRPENGEIVGAPDWVRSERYDLRATANATTSSDDLRLMLRPLLTDRLKLAAHLEPREQPVYFLVKARTDGRLGPSIEQTTRDCAAYAAAGRSGLPTPVLTPPANGAPPCGLEINDGDIRAGGVTMDLLARNLGRRAGRVVFDRSGIDGYFDLTLKFSREPDPNRPDAPSFFTALQEQLGLKLESGRAPLQTLVIDHIERPSDN
jgi:bla regulator protein blaR1